MQGKCSSRLRMYALNAVCALEPIAAVIVAQLLLSLSVQFIFCSFFYLGLISELDCVIVIAERASRNAYPSANILAAKLTLRFLWLSLTPQGYLLP